MFSVVRPASRASVSLRLKPEKIWPKSKPHHYMPATMATSANSSAARHGHGRCVRTAMRGALIENWWRTRRQMADGGTGEMT